MRRRAPYIVLAAAAATAAVLVSHPGGVPLSHPERSRVPAELQDGAPGIWIFVRPGCRHCERHLAALSRSLEGLPSQARTRIFAHVHLVGAQAPGPAGLQLVPARWRQRLGVRTIPTTWLVDAQGGIVARWLGPLDVRGWNRALAFVLEGAP